MGGPWVAWPESHVKQLRALWIAGNSAGQIAKILGGYSRSAVIGKIHRIGLSGRSDRQTKYRVSGVRKSRKRRRPSGVPMPAFQSALAAALAAAPIEPLPAMPDAPAPADQRRSLLELEPHHCRWPIGDTKDPDFHFCGARKVAGLSYCLAHARKAYQPPQPRRTVPAVKAPEVV